MELPSSHVTTIANFLKKPLHASIKYGKFTFYSVETQESNLQYTPQLNETT